MKNELILLLAVFIPVCGAFVLPLAGRISAVFRNSLGFLMTLAPFVMAAMLVPPAAAGRIATVSANLPLGFNFVLIADCLAVFMALVSSFLSTIIVLYSAGYIRHYKNQNEYYLMVVLFLGGMMGLVFSGNLIFLYIFWEITAVASWRLIGFFRGKEQVLRADKAFMVTVFGALLMLTGFIMLREQTGSFDLAVIKESFKAASPSNIALALIFIGILTKSATLPFHTWLPDAGVAPSPVTALLHAAVLVKIGVYVFARLFIVTFTPDVIWHTIVPVVAAVSTLVSAGAALRETDLKRIIAYSTISQIGFIFLGLSMTSEFAIAGGLLYILMHGIAKAGLFLCAGIVEQNTHERDITSLGGLIKTMPVTAISFLFCSFSVMGIPPFGGFFSKYMVIAGAIQDGHLYLALAFLAGGFLTLVYLLRVFNAVFLKETTFPAAKEKSPVMVVTVAVLAVLSLASGILINYSSDFIQITVQQMTGMMP